MQPLPSSTYSEDEPQTPPSMLRHRILSLVRTSHPEAGHLDSSSVASRDEGHSDSVSTRPNPPPSQQILDSIFTRVSARFNIPESIIPRLRSIYEDTPPEEREIAVVCYLTELIGQLLPESPTPADWRPTDELQSVIQGLLSSYIMDAQTLAYDSEIRNGEPLNDQMANGLERRVLAHLGSHAREEPFVRLLPVSFDTSETGMSEQVLRVVKQLADHARDQLQAQLLHNIIPPFEQNTAVPRLQSLFVRIVQSSEAGSQLAEAEIWEHTNEEDKGRLALLQLIAVEFYRELSQPIPSERGSLWRRVDSRLEWVSTLSKNHQAKYHKVIMFIDQLVFDGVRSFATIEDENATMLNIFDEYDWEGLFDELDSKPVYRLEF